MAATKQSWKAEPFGAASPIPYERIFAPDEFAHMRAGLVPQSMDEKWFIYFEAPFLYFHRSWGGVGVYRIELVERDDGVATTEVLCAEEVLRRSSPEYEARLLAFLIGRLLLGEKIDFPLPPSSRKGPAGLLQHLLAGTAHPEIRSSSNRRSWWPFKRN